MSSNRANAAARQRRAGGNEQQPPPIPGRGPPQGRPGQQQQMAPPNAPIGLPKQMTIQNAIALITIRLGRVETIVQNLDAESDGIQNQNSENGVIIDKGVFDNMVSRLDALERGHKLLSTKATAPVALSLSPTIAPVALSLSPAIAPAIINVPPAKVDNESVTKLTESVEVLKAELSQVKDLLLKLQSFTMETNQKLADIVFSEEPGQDQDQDQDMDENRQIVFLQQNMTDLDSNSIMNMSVSLKDLIQKELAATDISEIIEEDA
jgi:hypothetical protein